VIFFFFFTFVVNVKNYTCGYSAM